MNWFDTLLIQPMINVLVAIYHLLASLHIPYALGFAIVLFTAIVRLAMNPLMKGMLHQQKKMQEMKPHIDKLKEKYKNDAKQHQMAQMELFRQHGINPLAGCLPLLLQFPLFIALYQALLKIVSVTSVNDLNTLLYDKTLKLSHMWDTTFFGLSLGASPSTLLSKVGVLIFLVPVITGALQLLQSKMMAAPASATPQVKGKEDDFSVAIQKQMLFMVPLMVGFFSFTFPLGITLYWNTFTIFGIIQQYKIQGWGGAAGWIKYIRR